MLGKRLQWSDQFAAFPSERYVFDHAAFQGVVNLYKSAKDKVDSRFMEKLLETGITVRAEKVFERELRSTVNPKRTLVSAWNIVILP